ncbi:MAG: barstar family protein [Actinobacteria bacterium]|nr:barstar family protein [Actinomycetota bacterium]
MTEDEALFRVETESSLLLAIADDVTPLIHRWREAGLVVRRLRGHKMRTLAGLYDEAAAALQFPGYFGENLDALEECLTDLPEWIDPGGGYVLVITDADELLRHDPLGQSAFAEIVANVQSELSEPVMNGEWWDRPAIPFHVVLVCREDRQRRLPSAWSQPDDWRFRRVG